MGLEIGVGLAHLAQRTLIFYDAKPLWRGSHPSIAEDESVNASILDLFEVPGPTLPEAHRAQIAADHGVRALDWPDAFACVFRHPAADPDARRFEAFRNRRPTVVGFSEADEAAAVLRFAKRSLSFYSYFFYLPEELRAEVRRAIAGVRPRAPYRQLADEICASFGAFNAVHIRRGDFMNQHYSNASMRPQTIAANLASVMPRNEPLLIFTDASADTDFFAPILEAYPGAILFEQHLLRDQAWRERLRALPCNGDVALALISQIVAGNSRVFAGSLFSTFTALIHRERGLRTGEDAFLFAFNPLDSWIPFKDCAFGEWKDGIFSWNRFPHIASSDIYAWFREWPEAFR